MFGALQVGMKLHAMYGADGKYYPSEVVALAKRKNPVKVHYIGFENDAWVSTDMLKYKKNKAIQQLLERTGEEAEKKVAEEVEQQVATRVAAAIQKLEVKLSATKLEFFDAVSGASLLSRVASMESELAKFSTDISADLGHMQHGLMTAKEDIQGQATKLEKEISEISTGMERMDMKMEMKLSETTCSLDELSEKVAALGMDLKEQTMTASPPNDYSESGFASVKQDEPDEWDEDYDARAPFRFENRNTFTQDQWDEDYDARAPFRFENRNTFTQDQWDEDYDVREKSMKERIREAFERSSTKDLEDFATRFPRHFWEDQEAPENQAVFSEHLETLGLEPPCTFQEVKRAYRRLALRCHPDKNKDLESQFRRILSAYKELESANQEGRFP